MGTTTMQQMQEAIDRLTIQRDAAEALAREAQAALVKVAALAIVNARCVDEMQAAAYEAMSEAYDNGMSDGHPLAELRPKGIVGVKADFNAIVDRARGVVRECGSLVCVPGKGWQESTK